MKLLVIVSPHCYGGEKGAIRKFKNLRLIYNASFTTLENLHIFACELTTWEDRCCGHHRQGCLHSLQRERLQYPTSLLGMIRILIHTSLALTTDLETPPTQNGHVSTPRSPVQHHTQSRSLTQTMPPPPLQILPK